MGIMHPSAEQNVYCSGWCRWVYRLFAACQFRWLPANEPIHSLDNTKFKSLEPMGESRLSLRNRTRKAPLPAEVQYWCVGALHGERDNVKCLNPSKILRKAKDSFTQ